MKIVINTILCGFAAVTLSSCVTTQSRDKNAPTGPPAATLNFTGTNAAYWLSAGGGQGTLNYNWQSHPFSATVVGAGGTGVQRSSAIGNVYNLTQLADFPGRYTGQRSGFTIFKGKQYAKLTNKKGVTIYAEAKTIGLASSAGVITVEVKLK